MRRVLTFSCYPRPMTENAALLHAMVTKLETPQDAFADIAARVEIHRNFASARADWLDLASRAPASLYQSFDFARRWFEAFGARLTPMIVIARNGAGSAIALLPLAIRTLGPIRVAVFLGGRESNFNLGLFDPASTFDGSAARRLLSDAARACGVDVFYFANLPRRFGGACNPLALSVALDSPSHAYGLSLPPQAEALDARASKDARRKLRRKEARLAELGPLLYEHAPRGEKAREIAAALLRQKAARFAAQGVAHEMDSEAMRAFLDACAAADDDGALEMHALRVGDRIVAAYAGLRRDGRFSAMMNSFDIDPSIARCSPGDLLLHALLKNLVARGFKTFDLGAGEARYKDAICDETIRLCVLVYPASFVGAFVAPALRGAVSLKRVIKRRPHLASFAMRLAASCAAITRPARWRRRP